MAAPSDTIRLVELVCARLCHDLSGLIGTVGNALDLVAEDVGQSNEILAYATSAAHGLTRRLRLMRTAWGPEVDPLSAEALLDLVGPVLGVRRVGVDARGLRAPRPFPAAIGRVALNLILLACDCLPAGGTIVLAGTPSDLVLRLHGPGAAWPAGFVDCMNDAAHAIAALSSARAVQMPLAVLFALTHGLELSPVLAGSGIAAIRLRDPGVGQAGDPGPNRTVGPAAGDAAAGK